MTALTLAVAQPVAYRGVPGGGAWQAGDFAAAYQEAIQVDTAAAQLLASRAATDQAVYLENESAPALAWLNRATAAAQWSYDLDPTGPLAAAATMAALPGQGRGRFPPRSLREGLPAWRAAEAVRAGARTRPRQRRRSRLLRGLALRFDRDRRWVAVRRRSQPGTAADGTRGRCCATPDQLTRRVRQGAVRIRSACGSA